MHRTILLPLLLLVSAYPAIAGLGTVQVPIRWCAVEGSSAAAAPECTCEDNTNQVLWRRHQRASQQIFLPQCNFAWRSAAFAQQPTFPVVPDPCDPAVDAMCPGQTGDILFSASAMQKEEVNAAFTACYNAWEAMGVGKVGLMALNVRRFINSNGDPTGLYGFSWIPGFSMESMAAAGVIAIVDNDFTLAPTQCVPPGTCEPENPNVNGDPSDQAMGHEALHSIGQDHLINPSTVMLPSLGAATDAMTTGGPGQTATGCPFGVPQITSQCGWTRLQSLCHIPGTQVELLGDAPSKGADPPRLVGDEVPLPARDVSVGAIDLTLVSLMDDPVDARAAVIWRVDEAFPRSAKGLSYAFALDVDDDPGTGGDARDVGVDLALPGVEVVGMVRVDVRTETAEGDKIFDVASKMWQYEGGSLSPVDSVDSGAADIEAIADYFPPDPPEVFDFAGYASITFQRSLIAGAVTPRFQVRADDPGSGVSDAPPPGRFFLTPPELPVCTASPDGVLPGEAVSVMAANLVPNDTVSMFLGLDEIATDTTDEVGALTTPFNVPVAAVPGEYLVHVESQDPGIAITADCAITVLDASAPGTPEKLRADLVAGELMLQWDPPGGACAPDDYAVYSGDLTTVPDYAHAARTCTTLGATSYGTPLGDVRGSEYFLVVPLTSGAEGSYGQDGFGGQRPPALSPCRPLQNTNVCR